MRSVMRLSLLLLAILVASSYSSPSRDRNNKSYRVVCYYGGWAFYLATFRPEDTNPNVCTHMVYAFATLKADNTVAIEDSLDEGDNQPNSDPWGEGLFRRINNLRTVNPHLTTLLSIGGWNEGSDKYSKMASSAASRKVFVDSVVKMLVDNDFDGLDLDWEYPGMKATSEGGRTPGNPADKANYLSLLRELRSAFEPHGFVLSAAVSPGKPTIDLAYDVPEVSKLLDFMNVMTYDFHVGSETKTAHQSPLYPRPTDKELDKEFTVQYAVDYWIKLGADPKKIVIGMPLYGRGFLLENAANTSVGAPAYGDEGVREYRVLCQHLKSNDWKVYRDDVQKVPYAVNQGQKLWFTFEDEQSLKEKTTFLKSKGLGGAMVWSIDQDDFKANCGKGKFPLLKTISRELNGIDGPDVDIPVTHISAKPGTITTSAPQTGATDRHTQGPNGPFQCKGAGYFADPKDETIFHNCVDDGKGGYRDLVVQCPPGTVFNEHDKVCV